MSLRVPDALSPLLRSQLELGPCRRGEMGGDYREGGGRGQLGGGASILRHQREPLPRATGGKCRPRGIEDCRRGGVRGSKRCTTPSRATSAAHPGPTGDLSVPDYPQSSVKAGLCKTPAETMNARVACTSNYQLTSSPMDQPRRPPSPSCPQSWAFPAVVGRNRC